MKHNRIAMMAFILIQLFAGASQLKAQFRIVDEQDGKPVSGGTSSAARVRCYV